MTSVSIYLACCVLSLTLSMLCKKVKKATLGRFILIFEVWVHSLKYRQHTQKMMTNKTTTPGTEIATLILIEPVLVSVSVSEKEKKYDQQSKNLIYINRKFI